jgi:signal peptidase I
MTPTLEVGDRLVVEKLSYDLHPPHREDIVVFHAPPALIAQGINEDLIKRVIAVPGDVVTVKQGSVSINGQQIKEPYIEQPPDYNLGPVTLPAGEYMVLGDNRNHSYDSHDWGFLPASDIVGRAMLRVSPLRHFAWF